MSTIHQNIEAYYCDKVRTYGATPKGVDWNDESSQMLRFEQLLKVVRKDRFSLGDVGCGYGKMYDYLIKTHQRFKYFGYDLSKDMIEKAQECYGEESKASFLDIESLDDVGIKDYMVASGIFNVKMQHNHQEWLDYILDTVKQMSAKSKYGFSFNALTKYSDQEYMRKDLYYADPMFLFDYCKRNFSRHVSVLHDYGLYEFTILVTKEEGL